MVFCLEARGLRTDWMGVFIRAEGVSKISPPVVGFRILTLLCAAMVWACAGTPVPPVSVEPSVPANSPIAPSERAVLEPEVPIDSSTVTELLRLAEAERRAGDGEAEYGYLAQVIELEQMLDKVAKAYEREVETAIMGMTSLIEPLMIAAMGLAVGFIHQQCPDLKLAITN